MRYKNRRANLDASCRNRESGPSASRRQLQRRYLIYFVNKNGNDTEPLQQLGCYCLTAHYFDATISLFRAISVALPALSVLREEEAPKD